MYVCMYVQVPSMNEAMDGGVLEETAGGGAGFVRKHPLYLMCFVGLGEKTLAVPPGVMWSRWVGMETPEMGYRVSLGAPTVHELVEEDLVARDFRGKPFKTLDIEATKEASFKNK